MIDLLTYANHTNNQNCVDAHSPKYDSKKYPGKVPELRDLYEAILAQAQTDNLAVPSTGKRCRPKQSKSISLIVRPHDYAGDV